MILTGDGLAWLASGGDVDHIICDPPYDQRTHSGSRSSGATESVIDFAALDAASVERLVSLALSCARRWVVCFCSLEQLGTYQAAAGPHWVRAGVWDRPDGTPQISGDRPAQGCEGIAIMHRAGRKRWNGGGRRGVWRCGVERVDRCHPTQKPVELMRALILDFTDPGETVADPFCGSGTTGVACTQLGRHFVGVEQRPDYAAIARERIAAAEEGQSLEARRSGQTTLPLWPT